MSSERGLWNNMQPKVSPFGCFKRIENSCDLGTPDVAYTLRLPRKSRYASNVVIYDSFAGWLELKEEVWPKRDDTPLLIKSLSREQVLWQAEWERAGGRVGTLAQVDRDYLFLPAEVLRLVFRRMLVKSQLQQYVLGSGTFPTTTLIKRLTA